MTSIKVEALAHRLEGITDPFGKDEVLAALYSRIAAGLENIEPGSDLIGFSGPDAAWVVANTYLSSLARIDPDRAFQTAVSLTTLPVSENASRENIDRWIRTSGLALLGMEENISRLDIFLATDDTDGTLVKALSGNMNIDITDYRDADDFHDPKGFTALQSIYIGMKLAQTGQASQSLSTLARDKKDELATKAAARIISTFEGCEHLGDLV